MESTAALQVPLLLIAMPQVMDPFFHRSVILLVHHDDEGSVGFILNRTTEIEIPDIMTGMKLTWSGAPGAVAHFGGPVQPQLGTVLYPLEPPHDALLDGSAEVCPGVAISQHVGDLEQLASDPPKDFRLMLGYAGWGAEQLMDEILRNDWMTAPGSRELIFTPDPEEAWIQALAAVGVDPSTLPSWSPTATGDDAN
ncbi:MAG: YqgE/AlgH family protein [Thermoanaerobaculia bacterium]|nr:YqgE/AlgH family protein [Thermoanaerobaculia bacterium]